MKDTNGISTSAVRRWVHRLSSRTAYVGAELVALSLCDEGSEYVTDTVAEWQRTASWQSWDEDKRARTVAATLLENADSAMELIWEHLWEYDKTCDPSWLEG